MSQKNLGEFNINIIKWYPFLNKNSILQIGQNEKIEEELKSIFENVVVLNNIEEKQNIKDSKFNYIMIYEYEKYSNVVKDIVDLLDDNGKLLIIGNNETGINNWSKYSEKSEDGIKVLENHVENSKDMINVGKELKNNKLSEINCFYVFPNYSEAEIIINEKFDIKKQHIEKYNPDINDEQIRVFDEIKVLKKIITIDPKLLKFFTNSYFIEASKTKINTNINYVSFNNCRKEQYRLITIIKDDVVEKIPVNVKSNIHIENMAKTIKKVKQDGIEILDYEENNHIYSTLIKNTKTLDRILFDKSNDLQEICKILNSIKILLERYSINICDSSIDEEVRKKFQEQYKLNEEKLSKLHFMKNAYWDMVPKNCFYIDDKFVFFDQEWEKDYLPVEFIIYRSVINSYDLVRKIDVDSLFQMLELSDYIECFKKLDEEIRNNIIDEEIYEKMYNKGEIKSVDGIVVENKNFIQDSKNKQEYIMNLEKYIEDLKNDNKNKQEYIEILESKVNRKKIK